VRLRLLPATVLILVVAACGGGSQNAGTPATSEDPGGGNATYCATEVWEEPESAAVRRFNRAHRKEGFRARFQTLADDSWISDVCDVALVDSAWLAHHVQSGRLADLTERVEKRKDDFFGASLELVRYDDRYWAFPRHIDVGFLYYDRFAGTPPLTWQDAYGLGRQGKGLVYAGERALPLALHFLEVAYSAGGRVLSEDGAATELDSPQNLRALELMRRGIARGAVPRPVTHMNQGDARVALATGATVMRDWAFGYRALRLSRWSSNHDIIELPGFGDRPGTPVIAGFSVTVAQDARTEAAALALADYLTGPEEAIRLAKRHRLPTALSATYEGATVLDWLPYSLELERSLEAAHAHPITPRWPEMAQAIAVRVHAALTGRMTPRAALAAADRDVAALLSS
jgi:multiple sugar transport system substrate-binding protein